MAEQQQAATESSSITPLRWVALGVVAFLVALLFLAPGAPIKEGTVAPPLGIVSLEGEPVDLTPYKGKPLLLNFFATWCRPCIQEIPELNTASAALAPDANLVGVLVFSGGPEQARTELSRLGITYPVWIADDATAARWNVEAVPASFLLDGRGVVRWSVNGNVHAGEVKDAVHKLRQPAR